MDRLAVKKLDSFGMKYTKATFFEFCDRFWLATFSWPRPVLRAQSTYVSGAPSLSAYSAGAAPRLRLADDPQSAMITLHARVNEVNVLFIATDKHGKFVRDLNENDFSILDDHKPPQAIVNFRRETDLPLHLGLLIDVSGSVDSRFEFEQTAATSFLQHTLRAGFDKAFVEGFNTHTADGAGFHRQRLSCCRPACTSCTTAAERRFTTRSITPAKKSF